MIGTRFSSLLRKITILVMVCLCVNTAVALLDGSGTQEDPWLIQSLEDFNDFAADANYWAGFTRLETDVNLAGMTYTTAVIALDTDANHGFQGTAFTGVFDGNDHKIINLTIDDYGTGNGYIGLFGYIEDGEVKNLSLEGGSVSGGGIYFHYIGGLVGINDSGTITNCCSTGDVSGSGLLAVYVGGLVAFNKGDGSVSNCCSAGNVSSGQVVGGLVGILGGGYVSNCYSTSDVDCDVGLSYVGGLVGDIWEGTVSNCYSMGDVTGDVIRIFNVGGLAGRNRGSVSDCYSTGDVRGGRYVGGLVGVNDGSISDCYSKGDVDGDEYVGGLVGSNDGGSISVSYSTGSVNGRYDVGGLAGDNVGSISDCYSTGDVNGISMVGGLVGQNMYDISNCFWDTDTQTHGVIESIGLNDGDVNNVAGLTTSQLHQQSTFSDADWDFIHTWNIGENQTYPYLRTYLPSDINKDGVVNFLDIAITANQWLQEQ